jgi:hypothetical protein
MTFAAIVGDIRGVSDHGHGVALGRPERDGRLGQCRARLLRGALDCAGGML